MREKVKIAKVKPSYMTVTDLTFAQVESWFGHCQMDLKMNLIYPEDKSKKYPCIVWICGGAWLRMDKSAHMAYLSKLARGGFVVASVEYRTSNEVEFPGQLIDVKAAIRYLKAHADRYNLDPEKIGTIGESAGAHLALLAALDKDKSLDQGYYTEYSSQVQACLAWYPPTDFRNMMTENPSPADMESLLLGKPVAENLAEADKACPLYYADKEAVPIMLIHGNADTVVPFNQSVLLHDKLEKAGCQVTLIEIEGADHADLQFFQDEIWDRIAAFFKEALV